MIFFIFLFLFVKVQWIECPTPSNHQILTKCTWLTVPLFWNQSKTKISIFIKNYSSKLPKSKGQIVHFIYLFISI